MKVITCASFYGSGSSAIIDLFSEFQNVKKMGNYEFRIFYDIDGVSDLQFHLVECQNRHNSGHALKRFYKLASFYHGSKLIERYEPFFDNGFLKATKKYLSKLVDFEYRGWWFYDLYDKGRGYYFRKQCLNHLLGLFSRHQNNILKKEITFCCNPTLQKFLDATQQYSHELLSLANKENKEFVAIDQLLPSQNTKRILNYFKDDVYVFIVDRDPRDIYLCEMLSWNEGIVPHDPELFCKWFRYTRNSSKNEVENKRVFFVQFEDLVYKYEKTLLELSRIVGLSIKDHKLKFRFLNPKASINNTMLFKKTNKYSDAIKVIERELSEYLYDFDGLDDNVPGIPLKNKKVF